MKSQNNKQINKAEGIISISSKGVGYVTIGEDKNKERDPEIDFKYLNTALHGDMVEIILHPRDKGRPAYTKGYDKTRQTAEVSKIISRAKTRFAGALEEEPSTTLGPRNRVFFLKPDDQKMYTDILIPKENFNNAKVGQKVFVEIVSWEDARKAPIGKVIKILGKPGDNNTEMNAIVMEKGFDSELPNKVEEEAKKIKSQGIKESDYKGRRDFRKILTFTIDPDDAKDFDDAISFKEIANDEYEIGIHIADVSHYVKIGSTLDEEARLRGTSVYLVDRTIPMLPEILSNDLCSLVPNKDRLTMSAVFVVDKNAKIKNKWFGRAIIHSQKRFTYKEAEETIKIASGTIRQKDGNLSNPFQKALFTINNLAKKLTKERVEKGAISLEQEDVKFILDSNGTPIKVIKKGHGDSERLVEEFMLLANKSVAEILSKSISLYRIHDFPSKEKMADLAFFLRSLGHRVTLQDGFIPTDEINKLLLSLADKNTMKDTVNRAVIRSMAKAIYSTKNIGHYGLAFNHYTHFTSPIRRYPDIIVHRLLADYLAGKKVAKEKLREYEEIARISSEQEKRASDAERASVKYKQVEYMSKHLGKNFDGVISGINEWGMYIEEIETKCEGLARMRDMQDDFYVFNEKKLELAGQKKKKRYRLGDRVKIKVKTADLERKTIDYVLI